MLENETPISQFKSILFRKLSLSERHRIKSDSFESEEIDKLYKAFQRFEANETNEHLSALQAALKQCEAIKKDLPYQDLYALIEEMKLSTKRPSPR